MSDTFYTRDLGFAAYLITSGVELKETKLTDGSVFFYFEDRAKCEELKIKFHDEDGQVPAKKYHGIAHELKGKVWLLKNGNDKR